MVFWFQPNVNLPVTLVHYRGEQIRLDATQLNSNFLVLEMLLNHLFALDRSNQKFKIKDLVGEEYADWVIRHYMKIRPSFVSPFSANVSPLANTEVDEESKMQDAVTMFELNVLT